LLDQKPSSEQTNISEAYAYFSGKVAALAKEDGRVEEFFKIVANGVMLVVVTLGAGENPFAIFKSLKRRPI
jgi:hypothetical protein